MTSARERADLIVDTIAQTGISLDDAQWDAAVDIIAAALLAELEEAAQVAERSYQDERYDEGPSYARAIAAAIRALIKQKEERE